MNLFSKSYGSGPPLIILHGLYGSSDNWISIAKMLSEYYTVYLPDLRNHGRSPHSELMSYQAMSEDLLELTHQLNLDHFFLAGHSMGGKVAMSFALTWPEKISGLLIVDISPFVNEPGENTEYLKHKTILEAMYKLDLSKITTRNDADAELKKNIKSEKIRGFILKNLKRSTENKFTWKLNVPVLRNSLQNIMKGIDPGNIPDRQVTGFPVIFLKGSESDYINKDDYPDILKLFPAAEINEVRDAGHWLHADQPEELVKNLLRLSGRD